MNNLLEQDASHLWHPFDIFRNTDNILIERAEGIHLFTADGQAIKDMVSSWWTNLHGHNHPHIAQAIQKQTQQLSHVIFSGFTHAPAIQLAQRLLPLLPGEMHKLFLSDNGSTAVEVALKMAIQYWHNLGKPKKRILAFEGCYHGDTFGAMSLAGPDPFNEPFSPFLFEVTYLPFPTSENRVEIAEVLTRLLEKEEEIGAFVYEPMIQGVGGMRLFDREGLETLLTIAKQKHILLIADEVMTGFGRTGPLFASEYLDVVPDMVCLSKGITGGFLGMGATAANEKIYLAFQSTDKRKLFLHGHSYTGNALACASANASLDLLLAAGTQARITEISNWHKEIVPQIQKCSRVANVFALGTILSVTLKSIDDAGYFAQLAEQAYQYFLGKGLLLRPMGNVLYLSPPYCISEKEIKEAYQVLIDYLGE